MHIDFNFASRRARIGALAAVTLLGLAAPSYATHVSISGTHGPQEIKDKCSAAGGTFGSSATGYGCSNDAKGTFVGCNNAGKCDGWVPHTGLAGEGLAALPGNGEVDGTIGGDHHRSPAAAADLAPPSLTSSVGGGTFIVGVGGGASGGHAGAGGAAAGGVSANHQ